MVGSRIKKSKKSSSVLNKIALKNLKEYFNTQSDHSTARNEPCIAFLAQLAKELDLQFNIFRENVQNSNIVLTWPGTDPSAKSIMLNSRLDLMPMTKEPWTEDPYGSCTVAQSTKCIGVQYLEAIRRLRQKCFVPLRTVHVTFLSGEKNAAGEQIFTFLKSPKFKLLNVGFAIDEGTPSVDETLTAHCDHKRCWKFMVHCYGSHGPASLALDNTPGQKVQYILNKFYKFRQEQLESQHMVQAESEIITLNLTMMKGGTSVSQIPKKLSLTFDSRCPLDKFDGFSILVKSWCAEAGRCSIENCFQDDSAQLDDDDPFWLALKTSVEHMNIRLKTTVASGRLDGSQLRRVGIPTVGFSPNRNVTRNEFTSEAVFLEGVSVIEQVIASVTSV